MRFESVQMALRAYIRGRSREQPRDTNRQLERPAMVIDTETTEDEFLNLLFGSCGIWVSGYLHRLILFHPQDLPKKDIDKLAKHAQTHKVEGKNIEVMSAPEFVDKVFFPWIVQNEAICVGFNLKFDLSRLAVRYGYGRRKWKNGFTFWLTEDQRHPRLRIRALDSVRSFFTLQPTKYSGKVNGRFLDLRALGFALTNEKLTLKRACELFGTQRRKREVKQHGAVTPSYIDYNINDTLATYELYMRMLERLEEFRLDIPPEKAFSPASLGKAYLRRIGIRSFSEKNPDFPPEVLGYLMTTYYGGRSEVKIRKTAIKVRMMDFKSMYPTLFVLMGLWDFLISEKIEYYESTEETRKLVSEATLNSLANSSLYRKVVTIVQVQPEDGVLPLRAHYGQDRGVYNIGLPYVTSQVPLWYALPDVMASRILNGKAPKILRAISFGSSGVQTDLRPIQIPGGAELTPEGDLIKKLIEHRKEVQDQRDRFGKDSVEYAQLDVIQNQLKTLANALSYGIFVEINAEDRPTRVQMYGLKRRTARARKIEEFGTYFNPILATMLTSGARLMLAMAEAWLEERSGYYAFCDTDSIAVSPRHWRALQSFFQPLNPHESSEPLLKLEYDERDENGHPLDLWFYGISAKRYVLYRIVNGKPSIVKDGWSSHGLGHLLHENRDDEAGDKWEKDLWTRILQTAYRKMSEEALCEKYSGEYAVREYVVTKPGLHRRLREINRDKDVSKRIKPFNFVLVGSPVEVGEGNRPIHPITRFTKQIQEAPFQPFIDYNTGKHYPGGSQLYWQELSSTVRDYLNHAENKFRNGAESGKMKRRHVRVLEENIRYIGKEADQIEETEILGVSEDSYLEYR